MKRVRGKTLISIILILTIATFAAANMRTQASTPPPDHVRMYIWNPAAASNIYPALPFGPPTMVQIWIDTPAAWYNQPTGIVGVTASLRVDPNKVDVLAGQAMPDADFWGVADSFLGDFVEDNWYQYAPYSVTVSFLGGTVNMGTGTITGTAEAILGYPVLPGGAGAGPKPLWQWVIRTKVGVAPADAYSAITISDAYYTTYDGVKHPVDIVDNGHYGTPPPQFYMNSVGSPLPQGDPTDTTWHELYPRYSNMWQLTSWIDNGDTNLTPSDQIDMVNATGWTYWFHVDVVTVTIHWTFKAPAVGEGAAESPVLTELDLTNPIGTAWHQVYPDYSREFVIRSWEDNGDGELSISDQFDFEYLDEPGVIYWAHLDEVSTDIILSQKGEPEPPMPEFPLGLGLMIAMAPAIPIVYLWRTRRKGVMK